MAYTVYVCLKGESLVPNLLEQPFLAAAQPFLSAAQQFAILHVLNDP